MLRVAGAGPRIAGPANAARDPVHSGTTSDARERKLEREQGMAATINNFTEKRFDTGVVELNYAEGPNSGHPMVLIHGIGSRWQAWLPVIPHLSRRWKLFAVDLRGHGRSGRVSGRYVFADYPPDISAFVTGVIGEPAVLFGHSLGGMTAIGVAADAGQTVRAAVLEDPPVFITERPEISTFRDRFATSHRIILETRGSDEIYRRLRETDTESDSAVLRFRAESLSTLDPDVYAPSLEGRHREGFEVETKLGMIAAPTLLLQGNADLGGAVSDDDAARVMSALSRGTLVKFADVGHGIHSERPEETVGAVEEFLARALPNAAARGGN